MLPTICESPRQRGRLGWLGRVRRVGRRFRCREHHRRCSAASSAAAAADLETGWVGRSGGCCSSHLSTRLPLGRAPTRRRCAGRARSRTRTGSRQGRWTTSPAGRAHTAPPARCPQRRPRPRAPGRAPAPRRCRPAPTRPRAPRAGAPVRGTRSARHASRAAALRGPPPAAAAGSAASRGRPRPPARAGWRPPRTQRPPSAVPRPAGGRRPPPPRRASRRRPRAGPGPATPSPRHARFRAMRLGGGQVVGRVVDVALVPLEVGCREPAVPLEGGGPLVAGLRRAGRVPLALAQHELAVLGEQPQRVDLVVEGAEERLAHRRVAPGGRVGAGDQGRIRSAVATAARPSVTASSTR